MKNFYHAIRSKLTGRNTQNTPSEVVTAQMNEVRPLPLGRAEFDVWASRIISGSILEAAVDSQRFALANMLLHLGPTESHKPDAFFIHSLRKFAINQVADDVRKQLHEEAKARTAAEEAAAVPVTSVALVSSK
jgi:hypothetical protein